MRLRSSSSASRDRVRRRSQLGPRGRRVAVELRGRRLGGEHEAEQLLTDRVVKLEGEPIALGHDRQLAAALEQPGVGDGDRGMGGQQLDQLLIGRLEHRPGLLLGQIEGADHLLADADRHAEERAHIGMSAGPPAPKAGIGLDVARCGRARRSRASLRASRGCAAAARGWRSAHRSCPRRESAESRPSRPESPAPRSVPRPARGRESTRRWSTCSTDSSDATASTASLTAFSAGLRCSGMTRRTIDRAAGAIPPTQTAESNSSALAVSGGVPYANTTRSSLPRLADCSGVPGPTRITPPVGSSTASGGSPR